MSLESRTLVTEWSAEKKLREEEAGIVDGQRHGKVTFQDLEIQRNYRRLVVGYLISFSTFYASIINRGVFVVSPIPPPSTSTSP